LNQDRIGYQEDLNPAQLEAVTTSEGPVLVIAGAGSGKTRTLVYRVARLVEMGIPPDTILLLTFTRKAAGEMLERAAGLADPRCRSVSGGTFHSLAHRVLRQHGRLLGFDSAFTVLDRSDMEEIIKSLVRENHLDQGGVRFPKRTTLANILSKAANLQLSVEAAMTEEYPHFLGHAGEINRLGELYREYKQSNQLMDYDDLIIFLRQVLSTNKEVRRQLNRQYQYVMVDEYQDTNSIQADIVYWLAHDHQNVMVVGDDSQSIYSFRGANYRNMFDFPTLFSDPKIIKLEENYRSTQPILSFTNALMSQAEEKYTKCLFTKRREGVLPKVINARTEPEQALFICQTIRERMDRGRSLRDFAILFRAAHHSFTLEVELTRQGMPFVKYGGFKFMESAHIKDFLAHLRVVVNGEDTLSWGRILRLIKNIGPGKSQSIIAWLRSNRGLPWQIADWPGAGKSSEGLKELAHLLKGLSAKGISPKRAAEAVIAYYDPILQASYDDFPRRQRDLEQLIPMAGRYRTLRAFLDDIVLEPPTSLADMRPVSKGDYLTLSTVHSAKGLEWPVVFIIWVMEGYFPSARSHFNPAALEEERRLMYVAATRAKDRLIMCYPGQQPPPAWHSAGAGLGNGLSSFIRDLPPEVVEFGVSDGTAGRPMFTERSAGIPISEKPAKAHPSGLRQGDRVSHPAFGQGVVSKFVDTEKVEVLFRDTGRKLLHLGYTTLEKT
jgi:DNA helicase-2/ATP-dependent DNA helicase PcrA